MKAIYRERASQRSSEKAAEIAAELQALESERNLLVARMEEVAEQGQPLSMSSASFREVDLAKFNTLVTSATFRAHHHIDGLRAAAMTTTPPLGADRIRDLAKHLVWVKPDAAMPPWAQCLAKHREAFRDVAILLPDADDHEEVWLLLYMVQNPIYVAVVKLEELDDVYELAPQESQDLSAVVQNSPGRNFKVNFAKFASAADMPEVHIGELRMLFGMEYVRGHQNEDQQSAFPSV